MAITRKKKEEIISGVSDILAQSKMTVVANYSGLTVAEMQTLRRAARAEDVVIKVAKNRLVKRAFAADDKLKDVDSSMLKGQLAIAIGLSDEVAPAQVLARFAKEHPQLELIGGVNANGDAFDGAQIKQLSELPSKDVLRGQLVGTIAAPLSGFVSVLAGNIRGLNNVLNARKDAIS
ncbi:50S ribosomal protein L10 [Candidatus Saccharibacteria bacterium]|jgi:large subunit ribosomal protein L10|nr:50S ribosomal protein L10 [Candidatus Saccharibacteria bacterium]